MRLRLIPVIALACAASFAGAETSLPSFSKTKELSPLSVDLSGSGLMPYTWATDSPTLSHWGLGINAALEYSTDFSVPIRLELGYIGVQASAVASDGESYKAWDGMRFALLSGYDFAPIALSNLGELRLSALAGGAITAAEYTGTPLAYAYPSLLVEPRLVLALKSLGVADSGPFLQIPVELQFRAGNYSLAPGLSLGFRYRITWSK